MVGRDELEAALRTQAAADVPGPDASFAEALEQRLSAGAPGTVVPLARRARRVGASAVIAATVVFAGAAAAAGVAVTRPFDDDPAPATSSSSPTTTSVTTTTDVVSTDTTSPSITTPVTSPATSAPITTAPAVTEPPTTVRVTLPPATTAVVTTTTEVRTPATISLTCVPDAGTVRCTWTGAPTGTVQFAVLRSQPGTGPGRVYTVDAATTTWLDPIAANGTSIGYVVHALDASGNSIGHSTLVTVTCC